MSDPSSLHAVTPTDGTSVTVYEDGPLIVRGEFVIRAMDGSAIEPGRSTVALCRCGYSAIRPFCDGSHRRAGFTAPGDDERRPVAASGPQPELGSAPPAQQLPACRGVEGKAASGAPQDV